MKRPSSSLVFPNPFFATCNSMGSVLCRQREGPWVYGVASPITPPSKVPDISTPVQLALISPSIPPKPARMDSVDPIRSAITSMGGWGEPVSPPPPVKHVSTAIP